MTRPRYYTITHGDVGQRVIRPFDNVTRLVGDFMGRILPGDVGKRVYAVPDPANPRGLPVLQVENDKQRHARTAGEATR